VGLGVVLAAAGLVVLGAGNLEGQDSFCGRCHLPPEATFVARASAGQPVDLASAHARPTDAPPVACVGCHGGTGVTGRLRSLAMGADDGLSWLLGDFTVLGPHYLPRAEPGRTVPDGACRACHDGTVRAEGFENHFHNRLLDPERPAELTCSRCHVGHDTAVGPDAYLVERDLAERCAECHRVMGGPSAPLATAAAAAR
jgi:hypothetical protein